MTELDRSERKLATQVAKQDAADKAKREQVEASGYFIRICHHINRVSPGIINLSRNDVRFTSH